jgi:glycosyltransferase involved in cell wall biosynthesis
MKTPVIIAARNEEAYIGRALDHLPANLVEPFVMVNGSEDRTAEIALDYGATVFNRPEAGKLPAMQEALRFLGERSLEPVLMLDADSFPLFSRAWARRMVASVAGDRPRMALGPLGYADNSTIDNAMHTAISWAHGARARTNGRWLPRGANFAMHAHKQRVARRIAELPHIWPGEDAAFARIFKQEGSVTQLIDPRAMVITSARYVPTVVQRLKMGTEVAHRHALEDYLERAPEGSVPYKAKLVDQAPHKRRSRRFSRVG